MTDLAQLALTDLWSRAIAAHDQLPFTRSAALAALEVAREDRRRRSAGIPSIFDLDLPHRASAGRGVR